MGGFRRWVFAVIVPGALLLALALAGTSSPDQGEDHGDGWELVDADWAGPGGGELAVPVRARERPGSAASLGLFGPVALVVLVVASPALRARPWFRLAGGELDGARPRRRPSGVRRRAPPRLRPA